MWLLDQWAERHITEAQSKGEFDNLPGSGEPLILDDDPQYKEVSRRLSLLELKLRQAGLSTDFLRGDYADKLLDKINDN
ncbi:DUF1992 domain-containing protein [Escherichia coli]|nr:DnaJ family domain-containing protein [Escherichia coli]EIG1357307.1 DUF1992 domain-containing protein [Escherichia coli]EIG1362637.1 DUF1992 domain-containing protein [Escherichia coli]EIG1367036.1 DUF1992 domain-containing protein [Escherichia coli]EIG2046346.1 DUF1992 domain-containing protein [Escherichia coli]EJK2760554.1 DUF1992 domain-containing protein [Escherichia coli]